MELDILKQNTTWNDASASINNNFAKVKTALEQGGGGSLTIDTAMSDTSENAVQNKIIKKYVNQRAQQAYDQALEYTDEEILGLRRYTDTRVTPLYIEFGAVFPTTTTAGTILDSGYDAEEIAEAIGSGKGVMLIDSNGDTLFLSYYRHEEGKLLLQAVTHSRTGYLRLSLLFAAGTTACVWTSDQHNINEGGGGGSIDPDVLDAYTPLIRDFSDDFNNDFTR